MPTDTYSDLYALSTMAGHLIRRLNQQSTSVFAARAAEAGLDLTPVQFACLDAIARAPGIDQAGVAARIAYDRATIGGVIDRLQRKGWITRTVSDTDRRARVLHLTDTGEAMLTRLRPLVRALQGDILPGLSQAEQAEFLRLARLALAMESDGAAP